MNNAKNAICTVLAGATLGMTAPVFADSYRDRGYDHHRRHEHVRDYDHHGYRAHDRYGYRVHDRRPVIVERPYYVQQPYIIAQPVYYSQPAPAGNYGIGATLGAAIGGFIDNRQ